MDLQDTLLAFSEWLDSEGLIKPDTGKDKRTHEELAREFIEECRDAHLAHPRRT